MMQNTTIRSIIVASSPLLLATAAVISPLLTGSAAAQQVYRWTSGSAGTFNWSADTSWLGGVVPPTSGANVQFNPIGSGDVTSTINSAWSSAGSVNSLTFLGGAQTLADSGTLTLSSGAGVTSFTVGSGGINNYNGRNRIVFASPLTLAGSQSWTFVRPVVRPASLKTPGNYQPTIELQGLANGSAANTTLTLSGGPSFSSANVALGANVLLTGAAGAFGNNIGTLNLKGSNVQLGASATDSNFNRIADSTKVASYGGGLYVFRQGTGTEDIGGLELQNGAFSMLGATAGGSGTSTYRFSSLAARNNEAVLRLNSGATVTSINFQFVDVTGFGSGINGIVGGWAVGQTAGSNGTFFLATPTPNTTMTTVAGVTAANSDALNGYGATDNVTLTATAALTADRTFNSLRSTWAGTLDLGGFRLRLASGGVISDPASGGLRFGNGTVTAGATVNTAATLYLQQGFGGRPMQVNPGASIVDNGTGAVNVVIAADGGLDDAVGLISTSSSYTGFTGVYGAQLALGVITEVAGSTSPLGLVPSSFVANSVRVSGGLLYNNGGYSMHANRGIELAGAGMSWFQPSGNSTINGAISGEGQVNLLRGNLTFAGSTNNTYSGATVVSPVNAADTPLLTLNKSGGAIAVPGDLFISARDGATADSIVRLSASDQIADTAVVTLTRAGETGSGAGVVRFRLNGQNETVAGLVGSAVASPANSLIVENFSTTAASTLTLKPGADARYDFGGRIQSGSTQALNLVIDGNATGIQVLSGSNTYTGATTVSAGVLRLDDANALPGGVGSTGGSSALTINGGVIGLNAGDFTRGLGTTASTVQITGGGGFAAYGADRTVNLGGSSGTATWGSGSFITTVGGTFILGAASADKMVDFQNPIALGSAVRTVQVDNGSADVDATLSGVLSGVGGGLTKTGLGTLTVTAANTYTGTTSINAGTLAVNGAIGGAVNVANAAILGGSGSINGLVTVAAGGILAPGNSPGTLTMNSGLVLDASSILNFELNAADNTIGSGINDLIDVTGNFTLAGILNVSGIGDFSTAADNTKWRLFNYSGGVFTDNVLTLGTMPSVGSTGKYFQIDTATAGQVNLVIVPEPGAIALAGIGIAAAAYALRRRK